MKMKPIKFVEKCRVKTGPSLSNRGFGNNGKFLIPYKKGIVLCVVASDQFGWDHVSVSLPSITPTWSMMCFVKDLFFRDDEVVIQYHPKKKDYVNHHKHCLHMWRKHYVEIPTPPTLMVGPK